MVDLVHGLDSTQSSTLMAGLVHNTLSCSYPLMPPSVNAHGKESFSTPILPSYPCHVQPFPHHENRFRHKILALDFIVSHQALRCHLLLQLSISIHTLVVSNLIIWPTFQVSLFRLCSKRENRLTLNSTAFSYNSFDCSVKMLHIFFGPFVSYSIQSKKLIKSPQTIKTMVWVFCGIKRLLFHSNRHKSF